MFRAPRPAQLPHIQTILSDLPATTDQIARHLGLTPATIAKYKRTGEAPRTVQLALFWETQWGRATADTEAVNWANLQIWENQILKHRNAQLVKRLLTLESEISQKNRAANSPFLEIYQPITG